MIFYTFDARALTTATAAGSTRECAIASCRFRFGDTSMAFSLVVRRHYENSDNEHRNALNAHLSKKRLSYQ